MQCKIQIHDCRFDFKTIIKDNNLIYENHSKISMLKTFVL